MAEDATFPETRPAPCQRCGTAFVAAIVQTGPYGAIVWEEQQPVYQDLCPTCRAQAAGDAVPPPLVGGEGI